METLDSQDKMVYLATLVLMVKEDNQDSQGLMDYLERLASVDSRVNLVHLVNQDFLGKMEDPVMLERLAHLVYPAHKVSLVNQEHLDLLDSQGLQANLVNKVHLVTKEHQEILVEMGKMGHVVREER